MEHRWSSDGSKDNPTRLNPPAAIPPTSLLSTPPHTCAILSRPMSQPCPCLRENILRQACTDYEPRYRRLIPPFLWPFTARGWTSVGQEVGARQRHVLRATPPLEQPTRAALRVTCCHASRGGDVSTWLFCKLTSAITVSRRRNWRRKTRQLNSQSVRNFFPILSDFFPPQLELEVSKIEASLETWKLDLENSIFDEMALLEGAFLEIFLERKFLTKYREKIVVISWIEKISMN